MWWQEREIREADQLLSKGEIEAAAKKVDHFLKEHPQHGGAMALKARVLVAAGYPGSAISIFERFGASSPRDLHAWAQAHLALEHFSIALPLLEVVDKSGVDRADVLYELAACRAKLGDFDGALEAADRFAALPGLEGRGELLRGTINQQRGNLRLAAEAWGKVLKLSPDANDLQLPPEEFFLEYGRVLLAKGESTLAIDLLKRSVEFKTDPAAYVALGEAQFQAGHSQEAEDAFEKAMAEAPNSAVARKGLATLALADRDAQKAIDLLAPLERSPALTSEMAFMMQRAFVIQGDEATAGRWRDKADELRRLESARAAADQILRDTPNSSWATVIRAYRFALDGNWDQAESLLKPLGTESLKQSFIQSLSEAVRTHGELPPLQDLPLRDL